MNRYAWFCALISCLMAGVLGVPRELQAAELSPQERLGKQLFFDPGLSMPPGQSCATCHAPAAGFTGPDSAINQTAAVYPGADHTRFGNRKPPTISYGGDAPGLEFDPEEGGWVGGLFWDGRATGARLGDPLAEQAQGPLLNRLEQNLPDAGALCGRIRGAAYAGLFEAVWGPGSLDCARDPAGVYERVARAIAAYERSSEVNPFSSKYDAYLAGKATLTEAEASGLVLFEGKGRCAACHPHRAEDGRPLFTDFTYDNLGVPRNPHNPFYRMPGDVNPDGADWLDPGLGGFLKANQRPQGEWEAQLGKVKVPTLRNVDQRPSADFVKAYMHNGALKSLEEVVHFYNTRDVEPWAPPEVAANVNREELGNLGLTPKEESDIVAFLKTLTDGYTP